MALVEVPGGQMAWPEIYPWQALSFLNMTALGHKGAMVFQAPIGGAIQKTAFRVAAPAAPAGNVMRVSLQTLAGNVPSGTLIAPGAEVVINDPVAGTTYEVSFDTPPTVTRGQVLALVFEITTFGAAVQLTRMGQMQAVEAIPFVTNYATSWGGNTNGPLNPIMIDGLWRPMRWALPVSAVTIPAFVSTSTPNERGNRFLLPFAARIIGLWVGQPTANPGQFNLYDLANNVLAQAVFTAADQGLLSAIPSNKAGQVLFAAPVDLPAGSEVRATIKPTTTSGYQLRVIDAYSTPIAVAMPGGSNVQATSRKDTGAWTDTGPISRHSIGLAISHFDDGVRNRKVKVGGAFV